MTPDHFPRRDVDLSQRQSVNSKQMKSLSIEKVLKDSTARPWTASASYTGESIFLGNDGQNAGFIGGYADHPHNQANAELIVRSVNAFEPMRAALTEARDFVAGMLKPAAPGTHTISSYHPCHALLDKIDAALSAKK